MLAGGEVSLETLELQLHHTLALVCTQVTRSPDIDQSICVDAASQLTQTMEVSRLSCVLVEQPQPEGLVLGAGDAQGQFGEPQANRGPCRFRRVGPEHLVEHVRI